MKTTPCLEPNLATPVIHGPICVAVECQPVHKLLPEGVVLGNCPDLLWVQQAFPNLPKKFKCSAQCQVGWTAIDPINDPNIHSICKLQAGR